MNCLETPGLDCERLWHEYKNRVSGYIFSHVSNKDDRQDLVSQVFAKIVQAAPSYRGDPNRISSFVYKTAQNCVVDYYRTRKALKGLPDSVKAAQSVEEDFFKQSALEFLADALKLLPMFDRRVIFLHYYKNISLKKLALTLQESYGKIKLAHKRGLNLLKDKFKEFK